MSAQISHMIRSTYYNEQHALQELIETIESIEYEKNIHESSCCYSEEQIVITLNGKAIAFSFQGSCISALFAFIDTIAKENGYELNYY